MFAAPPELKAEVFARLPDSFLEGPSFDRAGNLYVVDIPYGRVFRISPRLRRRRPPDPLHHRLADGLDPHRPPPGPRPADVLPPGLGPTLLRFR